MVRKTMGNCLCATTGMLTTSGEVLNSCNCGSATVSSTTTPVELARPTQQGHRPPCAEQKSHGDQTLRHDSGVDDLVDELQQRNVTRAPVVAHNGHVNDLEKPARHAQQGHRSPCPRTATVESPWSTRPWGSASA